MDVLRTRLATLKPKRILDLATGGGGFAIRLAESVASYGELVAVDSAQRAVDMATKNLAALRGARAELADAAALPYPDGGFDIVGVANSLHHFEDPARVVAEATRVLASGGRLVVYEMHREAGTDAEMSHVLLHHWWAAIDTAGGTYHAETFAKDRFRELLGGDAFVRSDWDEESDPKDPALMEELARTFVAYRAKIDALDESRRPPLLAACEALEARVRDVGFRSAPSIVFIGEKA
ncbi:MAG TPA: methyltransferase domain-containing protein, partial [Spirochaetia bacterium]|nr:methyltransferase domain-containing protein [Spirochaetia bacterium]